MTEGAWLVMSQGPQPGQTFMLDRDWITVGRDPTNEIVINDPQVSRQHSRITRQGKTTVIEDLGSTNGTFANGMRLTGPHVLATGDVIGLGDGVKLTYYEVGIAADVTETVVGRPAAMPPPSYLSTPPPPPTAAAMDARPTKSKAWMWIGCGLLVLALILACLGVLVLDYLQLLPAVFYEPLRWLGFQF
jgi:predicted component of type VI protein secretion system